MQRRAPSKIDVTWAKTSESTGQLPVLVKSEAAHTKDCTLNYDDIKN